MNRIFIFILFIFFTIASFLVFQNKTGRNTDMDLQPDDTLGKVISDDVFFKLISDKNKWATHKTEIRKWFSSKYLFDLEYNDVKVIPVNSDNDSALEYILFLRLNNNDKYLLIFENEEGRKFYAMEPRSDINYIEYADDVFFDNKNKVLIIQGYGSGSRYSDEGWTILKNVNGNFKNVAHIYERLTGFMFDTNNVEFFEKYNHQKLFINNDSLMAEGIFNITANEDTLYTAPLKTIMIWNEQQKEFHCDHLVFNQNIYKSNEATPLFGFFHLFNEQIINDLKESLQTNLKNKKLIQLFINGVKLHHEVIR